MTASLRVASGRSGGRSTARRRGCGSRFAGRGSDGEAEQSVRPVRSGLRGPPDDHRALGRSVPGTYRDDPLRPEAPHGWADPEAVRFSLGNPIRNRLGYGGRRRDRKSTRLNSSHVSISYAVFCLKKKNFKTYYTVMY